MNSQSLSELVAKLMETARYIEPCDDGHHEEAQAARNRGLELGSYWAGAIDGHHVSGALFLKVLGDVLPEPPKPESCPECGQGVPV